MLEALVHPLPVAHVEYHPVAVQLPRKLHHETALATGIGSTNEPRSVLHRRTERLVPPLAPRQSLPFFGRYVAQRQCPFRDLLLFLQFKYEQVYPFNSTLRIISDAIKGNFHFVEGNSPRNLVPPLFPVQLICLSHLTVDTNDGIHHLHLYFGYHYAVTSSFSIPVYTPLDPPHVLRTICAISTPSGASTFAMIRVYVFRDTLRSRPSPGTTLL